MLEGWVCPGCRSINQPRTDRCYSCRLERDAADDRFVQSGEAAGPPVAMRQPLPPGYHPGTAAIWHVGPTSTPSEAFEAVRRAAAEELADVDPASIRAWGRLDPNDQLWIAGSFILVGVAVAMADGKVEPGELERAFVKTDDLAAETRSFVVNWAIGLLGERSVPETVMSTAFSTSSPEPAIAASRQALARLPEADRYRMTIALHRMAWHAMTVKNGSPPTPATIELRQLHATIERLGLDLSAAVAWVQENGP